MAEQKPFDIEQYIKDQQKAREAAAAKAKVAREIKSKSNAVKSAQAKAENKFAYADTVGKSMSRFEEQLKAFAIKMSRGDELSAVEEKEYKRILEQYKSVNTAYNKAMAEGQKILDATPGLQPKEEVAAPKDTDKDGIPDSIDATPGNVEQTPAPAGTPPNKGGTPPKGSKGSGDTPPKVPALTDAEQRAQALELAGEDFELPETIFNNVPSLKVILNRYVKEDWTESKLRKAIRDDIWFRKNSAEIKARYVQLYNYEDLVKTGQINPKVPGNTQYEQDIAALERQIADKARAMGSDIASDPDKIKIVAQKMYLTNQGIDDPMTVDFIAAAIRPIGSTIAGQGTSGYSGQALKDYQEIQGVARANGFRVKDIIPGAQTEQQVLQGIATGTIDANRLAQDARKLAAQGQPQYVRDLLGQGYNLDQVYAPYRQTMANLLEINADEIDLNDSTLRSAISDKGDMNIYEFKKTLKRDSRWQYTENAKQEVSDMTLKILRDFGFQG
jgi:hypothetical protein